MLEFKIVKFYSSSPTVFPNGHEQIGKKSKQFLLELLLTMQNSPEEDKLPPKTSNPKGI